MNPPVTSDAKVEIETPGVIKEDQDPILTTQTGRTVDSEVRLETETTLTGRTVDTEVRLETKTDQDFGIEVSLERGILFHHGTGTDSMK